MRFINRLSFLRKIMSRWRHTPNAVILPLGEKAHIFPKVNLKTEILYNFYDSMKNDQIQNVSVPLDLETLNPKTCNRGRKAYTARCETGNASINHLLLSRSFQLYWNHVGQSTEILSGNREKWMVLHALHFSWAEVSEVVWKKDLVKFQTQCDFFVPVLFQGDSAKRMLNRSLWPHWHSGSEGLRGKMGSEEAPRSFIHLLNFFLYSF